MSETEKIKKELLTVRKPKLTIPTADLLSSSSTLLNLGCTGKVQGAYAKGHYYLFVGDSQSGKTWFTLAAFAEASINKRFKDYRFIYDNGELGALMDIPFYFGQAMADRMEPPRYDKAGNPMHSETVEDLYDNIDDAIHDGRPFIYIQDSQDSLIAEADRKKYIKQKNARRKPPKEDEEQVAGNYGTAKAKVHSERLRVVPAQLAKNGSILIIINQTRDNIGTFTFEKKTRGGGHALVFYSTLSIWTSVKGPIKKTVRGRERRIGAYTQARVRKNRVSGRDASVVVPHYRATGLDDVGSCIDYLLLEKHWKKGKGGILAPEFDLQCGREELVHSIQEMEAEKELRALVASVWNEIEEACIPQRRNPYE